MKKTNIFIFVILIVAVAVGLLILISNSNRAGNPNPNTGGNNQPNSTTTGSGSTSDNLTTGQKPKMHGLVSMGDFRFINIDGGIPNNSLDDLYARAGAFDGVVVNINWSQIEPTEGNFDSTAIDSALDSIRAYNSKYPDRPLSVRLDVFSGTRAPDWAKNIGGSPITVMKTIGDQNSTKKVALTVGRFWSESYRQAWAKLQNFLANKYDNEPLIRETSFNSCASINDEPFRKFSDSLTIKNLHDAGLTDDLFKKCLIGSFADYDSWKNTNVAYAFNVFYNTDSGKPVADDGFTNQVIEAWRKYLGSRAVVAYHSIGVSNYLSQSIYDEFKKVGPTIEFQLHSPSDDYAATVAQGVFIGATAIEVWDTPPTFSFMRYDTASLKKLSTEINGN